MCIRASDGDAMCTCDDEYGEDDDNGVDDDCDVDDDDGGGDAGDDSDGGHCFNDEVCRVDVDDWENACVDATMNISYDGSGCGTFVHDGVC